MTTPQPEAGAAKCLKHKRVLGPKGKCCCTCVHHVSIRSHPWFDGKSIMNHLGWACAGMISDKPHAVIMSNGHGLCELWEGTPQAGKQKP